MKAKLKALVATVVFLAVCFGARFLPSSIPTENVAVGIVALIAGIVFLVATIAGIWVTFYAIFREL